MAIQIGRTLVLGSAMAGREVVDLPEGVTRWRLKHRKGYKRHGAAVIYLQFGRLRTEQWLMEPVGETGMRPCLRVATNRRGKIVTNKSR